LTVALTTGQHYRAACDHTVLPATHTQTILAFTAQPQGVVTALYYYLLLCKSYQGTRKIMQKSTKKRKTYKKTKEHTKKPYTMHIWFTIVCTSDLGNQQGSAALAGTHCA